MVGTGAHTVVQNNAVFTVFHLVYYIDANFGVMVIPITVITGWIFNQLYIFGSVLARPFDQLETDVPMHFICRNLEIDLKQAIGHAEIPEPIEAVNGILR